MTETDPSIQEELELERESITGGISSYRNRIQKLREKDQETLTDPVEHLLKSYIDPVAKGIVEWIMEMRKGPGRRAAAVPVLSEVPGDVSALLALKVILDSITKTRRFQAVAVKIGRAIEDEMLFEAFELQNSPLYERIQQYIDENPRGYNPDYRRKVLRHSAEKYRILWEPWDNGLRLHVGAAMIDLIIKHTGLVTMERVYGRRQTDAAIVLVAAPKLLEWIDKEHTRCEALLPPALPMLTTPLPYTGERDGGYLLQTMRRPIVRSRGLGVEITSKNMRTVFLSVNALAAVPWEVNTEVLGVVLALWEGGCAIPGAVGRADLPLPVKPADIETNPVARRQYKGDAREVARENMSARGRRLAVAQTLSIARRVAGRPIWFPMNLDFRGRMYCIPQYLSPQGADLGRGLLKFHRGVRLGARGLYWLKVHLANCFGVDKVSLDDRVKWVDENAHRICTAEMSGFWEEADSPVQFLAASMEFNSAMLLDNPEDFVSHLPIMVDGSCNGIQHLAALSRDSQAGAEVNLLPSSSPSDIYRRGAEEVKCILSSLRSGSSCSGPSSGSNSDTSSGELAGLWLDYEIDRDLAKRPFLIFPYGGTRSAIEKYIDDEVSKRVRKGKPHPFGHRRKQAVRFLANVMWDAMGRVVDGPRRIMQWTRAVASVASKAKKPIVWRTPSGFIVRQAYPLLAPRRVETRVGFQVYRFQLNQPTDRLDPRRQSQALAPNWIHSLDAAALHLTICRMVDRGVVDIAAVHDSYGTHAAHMDTLAETLREQFVEMYRGDPLSAFIRDVSKAVEKELPAPPPSGDLDIEKVLESPYFFA